MFLITQGFGHTSRTPVCLTVEICWNPPASVISPSHPHTCPRRWGFWCKASGKPLMWWQRSSIRLWRIWRRASIRWVPKSLKCARRWEDGLLLVVEGGLKILVWSHHNQNSWFSVLFLYLERPIWFSHSKGDKIICSKRFAGVSWSFCQWEKSGLAAGQLAARPEETCRQPRRIRWAFLVSDLGWDLLLW